MSLNGNDVGRIPTPDEVTVPILSWSYKDAKTLKTFHTWYKNMVKNEDMVHWTKQIVCKKDMENLPHMRKLARKEGVAWDTIMKDSARDFGELGEWIKPQVTSKKCRNDPWVTYYRDVRRLERLLWMLNQNKVGYTQGMHSMAWRLYVVFAKAGIKRSDCEVLTFFVMHAVLSESGYVGVIENSCHVGLGVEEAEKIGGEELKKQLTEAALAVMGMGFFSNLGFGINNGAYFNYQDALDVFKQKRRATAYMLVFTLIALKSKLEEQVIKDCLAEKIDLSTCILARSDFTTDDFRRYFKAVKAWASVPENNQELTRIAEKLFKCSKSR